MRLRTEDLSCLGDSLRQLNPSDLLPFLETINAHIFTVEVGGQPFVVKIIKNGSRQDREIAYPRSQQPVIFNRIAALLYRYYYPNFAPSHSFLMRDKLTIVQPRIFGVPVGDLPRNSPEKYEGMQKIRHFNALWPDVMKDSRLADLNEATRRALLTSDFSFDNIIYTKPDEYTIIDW